MSGSFDILEKENNFASAIHILEGFLRIYERLPGTLLSQTQSKENYWPIY